MTRRTLGAALLGAVANRDMGAQTGRWLVYYSNQAPVHAFDPYSLLILDSRYHPPLAPLGKQGKWLIGYISMGEASEDYIYFGNLLAEGLLLKASATWKGNRYIDIGDRRWHARLCEKNCSRCAGQGIRRTVSSANGRLKHVKSKIGSVLVPRVNDDCIREYMKGPLTEGACGRTIKMEVGELSRAMVANLAKGQNA